MKISFVLRLYYSLLMSIQCVEIRLALFFFFGFSLTHEPIEKTISNKTNSDLYNNTRNHE